MTFALDAKHFGGAHEGGAAHRLNPGRADEGVVEECFAEIVDLVTRNEPNLALRGLLRARDVVSIGVELRESIDPVSHRNIVRVRNRW